MIEKLTKIFSSFPGIGPRQASRFVYHLLRKDKKYLSEFTELVNSLKESVSLCTLCFRYFETTNKEISYCSICANPSRDSSLLMVVEKDTDFQNIEKSDVYTGKYFILGGTLSILEKEPEKKIRSEELIKRVAGDIKSNGLKEIVLATSINPDGENTAQFISKILSPLIKKHKLTLSMLGRGLSTGTELEYIDSETMKSALQNRK